MQKYDCNVKTFTIGINLTVWEIKIKLNMFVRVLILKTCELEIVFDFIQYYGGDNSSIITTLSEFRKEIHTKYLK